ncbi:MAG: hypothetical protein Alpg2KO_17240 [Alphaproteobacteria bacterium]
MSFGNWLKDTLLGMSGPAEWRPSKRPRGRSNATGKHYGWEYYVDFAVKHAKAGGTFDEMHLQNDTAPRGNAADFADEGYAELKLDSTPGQPVSLPLHLNMVEEICLRLRREGLRFPAQNIHQGSNDKLQDAPKLSREVARVEARIDELEAAVGKEQALGVAPAADPRLRPATEEDYISFIADHLEAGGAISISDDSPNEDSFLGLGRSPSYYMGTDYFVTADMKHMLNRMGVNDFSNRVLVADKDFWLSDISTPLESRQTLRVLVKPGVKQITTRASGDMTSGSGDPKKNHQIMVPGELETRDLPKIGRNCGARLGKLLQERGISIRPDQIEQHQHTASVKQFWGGNEPTYKTAASAPTIAAGP